MRETNSGRGKRDQNWSRKLGRHYRKTSPLRAGIGCALVVQGAPPRGALEDRIRFEFGVPAFSSAASLVTVALLRGRGLGDVRCPVWGFASAARAGCTRDGGRTRRLRGRSRGPGRQRNRAIFPRGACGSEFREAGLNATPPIVDFLVRRARLEGNSFFQTIWHWVRGEPPSDLPSRSPV